MVDTLRFIHSSDWHIGMTRRHLSESKQAVFRDARLTAIERLCDHASSNDVAAVLVAGDVFDGNQLDENIIISLVEVLGELTCPVVLQPGNHDFYQRGSVYCSPAFRNHRPDNVIVPTEPGIIEDIPGMELIVGPYNTRYPSDNPFLTALHQCCTHPKDPEKYRVGLAHGSIDTFAPSIGGSHEDADSDNGGSAMSVAELSQAYERYQLDYIALGDRHSRTEVTENEKCHIWYSGSPEVTDFDDVEKSSGHALLVTVDGEECRCEPLQCGEWSFHTMHREVHSRADIDALTRDLFALPHKRRTAVRLGLHATLTTADMAELDAAQVNWENMFAGFHLWDRHSSRNVLLSAEDMRARFGGYVAEAAANLSQLAENDDATSLAAQNALTLLCRLASQKGEQ